MEKFEEIEKEYNGYKIKSTFVKSLDDFLVFIEVLQLDLEQNNNITKKEIKNNKRWKIEVKIRNWFLALISEREVEVYDEDTAILMEIRSIDEKYRKFLEKILILVNASNYKALLKIVEFVNTFYDKHIEFLEKQREMLELELKGIHLISPNNGADSDELSEFIRNKLNEIEAKEAGGEKLYVKRGE